MKKVLISTILSAAVMFGLPALIFSKPIGAENAAIILVVVCVFVIIPLFMVFIGIYIGSRFNRLWFVPIISAAMYALAMLTLSKTSLVVELSVDVLLYQPLGFLAVGEIAALLTFLYNKSKSRGKENG